MGHGANRYAEYTPPAELRPFVQCFWTRMAAGTREVTSGHRVLPDGCVDLIVSVGAWSPVGGHGQGERTSGAWFVGTMTTPLIVQPEPGTSFIGVRCRPGAARALFGVPAAALTDERVPMNDLWSDGGELRDLLEQPDSAGASEEAASAADRLRAMARSLARRFAGASPPPADVRAAIDAILCSRGRIGIADLCVALGVTRQHLARRFAEHVGVTPKTFVRIERVRHVLRMARASGLPRWSRIAQAAGYADQSHMISEFGELVGVTPARWLAGP